MPMFSGPCARRLPRSPGSCCWTSMRTRPTTARSSRSSGIRPASPTRRLPRPGSRPPTLTCGGIAENTPAWAPPTSSPSSRWVGCRWPSAWRWPCAWVPGSATSWRSRSSSTGGPPGIPIGQSCPRSADAASRSSRDASAASPRPHPTSARRGSTPRPAPPLWGLARHWWRSTSRWTPTTWRWPVASRARSARRQAACRRCRRRGSWSPDGRKCR